MTGTDTATAALPIVLVPGFWLGAWAWDEVAAALRAEGRKVTALTLPGLESAAVDRSSVTFAGHVGAICDAVQAEPSPVVLVVHSGAGFSGYAATDRVPERIAAVVYVDTGPGIGAFDPDFDAPEFPVPSQAQLEANENLEGLTPGHLETFRRRAVPEPGRVLREGAELTNDARLDIPSTMVCTSFSSEQYRQYAREQSPAWLAGLAELRNLTWLDLPTSHWPMWSRPRDLAAIIADVARSHAPRLK